MITLKSFLNGKWQAGSGKPVILSNAVTGEAIAQCNSDGLDFAGALKHARTAGGRNLRQLNFQERGELLKKIVGVLNEHLPEFYSIAATYGATKADAYMDIEGGLGTLAVYASLGRKQLPAANFIFDGEVNELSKDATFSGRHLWVSLEGAAIQINAFNFPSWGMLEKLGPAFLAGMPVVVKPATATAWLTFRMVEVLIESGAIPQGALQLICGSVGDLLDHLTCQDVVAFTGSAATGQKIKTHPVIVREAVRLNIEADSLNCIVLGEDVEPEGETFGKFIREIVTEMRFKAGQKCTAIRRVIVPAALENAVFEALRQSLSKIVVGDPAQENVKMGPLVNLAARDGAREGIGKLMQDCSLVFGNPKRQNFVGANAEKGAFLEPILLHCKKPMDSKVVHEIEVFGPVATVMSYANREQAIQLARRGGGSLVASIYTENQEIARAFTFGLAPFHGRLMVMNQKAAQGSTGHGVAMPQLVHGGPGRAGGGEELGGLRAVTHYMQRVALQGSPERLEYLVS